MKFLKIYTLTVFLLLSQSVFSAEESLQDPLFAPLTDTQDACFQWFESNKSALKSIYQALTEEEKDIIRNKVLYKDNPQAVKKCLTDYVNAFCTYAQESGIELKYDAQTIITTILKMKIAMQYKLINNPRNLTEARMKVFSQLLTEEEKATVLEQNYLANPQATYVAMTKCGQLLAIEAVKLRLIEDTNAAKEKFACGFRDQKMAAIKHAYGKND